MTVEVQYKLRENEYYLKYLHTHSFWYKYLNRDSHYFKYFASEVKYNYRLVKVGRIEDTLNMVEMATKVLGSLNDV